MTRGQAGDVHPYRAAWETHDLDAWVDALSPDIALWSPIIIKPFQGRDAARDLFEILIEMFDDFEITHEWTSGPVTAFFWKGSLRGRVIEGADLVTTKDDGKITEIRVLIRPVVDIARFAAALGPPLARRRGRALGIVAIVLGAMLVPLFRVVDFAATRLAQKR